MAKISVIIPVKNGEATLEKCLQKIHLQTSNELEIIILNSTSTDSSVEIAKKYGAKIIDIADGTFNHGLTRNICVSTATNGLIYFTTQDAWLAEPGMLTKMASHFEDEEVMAVVGMQAVPYEKNTNPAYWFKRSSEPEIEMRQFAKDKEFSKWPLVEQYNYSSWDNVNAMYRKKALQKIPFVETNYAEDWLWAKEALANGMKLVRDPSVVVYHYHHMHFAYIFKEKFIINYQFYRHYNVKPHYPSFTTSVIKNAYHLSKKKELTIKEKCYWIFHNISSYVGHFFSVLLFQMVLFFGGEKSLSKINSRLNKKIPQGKQK